MTDALERAADKYNRLITRGPETFNDVGAFDMTLAESFQRALLASNDGELEQCIKSIQAFIPHLYRRRRVIEAEVMRQLNEPFARVTQSKLAEIERELEALNGEGAPIHPVDEISKSEFDAMSAAMSKISGKNKRM